MRVDRETFRQEVLEAEAPVLADFYADGCLPCKRVSAALAKIEAAYGSRVKIAKINVKYDQELAKEYNIMSTPTLLLFQQGKVTARLSGAVSQASIEEKLEDLLL